MLLQPLDDLCTWSKGGARGKTAVDGALDAIERWRPTEMAMAPTA